MAAARRASDVLDSLNGTLYEAVAGHALAGWHTGGTYSTARPPCGQCTTLRTGQVRARMTCVYDVPGDTIPDLDYSVVTSSNGRYPAADPLAMTRRRASTAQTAH
ncbi:hypothetical protein [Streptomyces sp. NPDC045470]|uniref:hypothetical protein n=1 Tax=Streptomyces sp. NPDC045470 TaxID=3155469 RepID=UPI00340B6DB5